jgi:hypothetical protein
MITAIIVGGVLLFAGGAATGVAITRTRTDKVLEQQTLLIAEIQDGQRDLVEAAGKPVVIDAEVRATLANVPPACVKSLGGHPLTAACSMQLCWSYGQSSAQRPPCDDVTEAALADFQKGTSDISTRP